MKVVVESNQLLVGIPFLQILQRISRTRGQGKQQRKQQGRWRRSVSCQTRQNWNPDPQVDTRIHWSSPDEGWVGAPTEEQPPASRSSVADLLSTFAAPSDSHYEFLGVQPDVDSEGIKTAYRRLSKLYHPDTTNLPAEDAARMFLRLQKAYEVLNSIEERKVYDWGLAQDISRRQGGGFVWPYEAEKTLKGPGFETKFVGEPRPEEVYLDLTGQMLTGLFFDGFALVVSISIIVYVAFFKHR